MPADEPRIGVLVVAYNAETTLRATLDRIPQDFRHRLSEVIILDDASRDGTHDMAREWAQAQVDVATLVVRHDRNLGYGGNQKAAYGLAALRGLDVVVLLHGDGQYAPELLPEMVRPIVDGDADAVFGSRMMVRGAARTGGMPAYKRWGNRILTGIQNRMLDADLTEFHSGYRAYRVDTLRQLAIRANSDGFDFDTQIIVQLLDGGHRIREIAIPTYYGDEICYVNGLKYAKDVVRDVVEYRLGKLGFGTAAWVESSEEYAFKDGDGSSHTHLLDMVDDREPLRVLDLGCSSGHMAERLRARGHHVTGVDMIEIPGVRSRVDEFHLADLSGGLPPELHGQFDVVIAADVIEHLADPARLLREIRVVLAEQGQALISVPNFEHWYPRGRVAIGAFGYDRRGPLDETHLRFFSRKSLHALVSRSGFAIEEERQSAAPLGVASANRAGVLNAVRSVDQHLARLRPELFAYQFILRMKAQEASVGMSITEYDGALTAVLGRRTGSVLSSAD